MFKKSPSFNLLITLPDVLEFSDLFSLDNFWQNINPIFKSYLSTNPLFETLIIKFPPKDSLRSEFIFFLFTKKVNKNFSLN